MNTYGDKIKQLRKENNLTQAELGEKLFVTSQAVSKWENGLSEPDLNSMKKMCELFNVSMDEFLEISNDRQSVATSAVPTSSSEEKTTSIAKDFSPQRVIEGYCEECNKALYAGEYEVVSESKRQDDATRCVQHIYCKDCAAKLDEQRRIPEQTKQKNELRAEKERAGKSFVLGGFAAAIVLISFFITYTSQRETIWLWLSPVAAYCVLTFIVQLFIPDSVVFDIMEFFTKSFRMPGIIFSLDLNGIISFICIKLVFGIISGMLSLFVFLIGVAISFVVSAFAFPFEISKYVKKYKNI